MKLKQIEEVKTEAEARQIAIDFQSWNSEQNLSYSEIAQYQSYLTDLGLKFNLVEEFKENGII